MTLISFKKYFQQYLYADCTIQKSLSLAKCHDIAQNSKNYHHVLTNVPEFFFFSVYQIKILFFWIFIFFCSIFSLFCFSFPFPILVHSLEFMCSQFHTWNESVFERIERIYIWNIKQENVTVNSGSHWIQLFTLEKSMHVKNMRDCSIYLFFALFSSYLWISQSNSWKTYRNPFFVYTGKFSPTICTLQIALTMIFRIANFAYSESRNFCLVLETWKLCIILILYRDWQTCKI